MFLKSCNIFHIYFVLKPNTMQTTNKYPELLKDSAYINGDWQKSEDYFQVRNPFNDQAISRVTDCNRELIEKGINAATNAFPLWSANSAAERAGYLRRWHSLIIKYKRDLAVLLSTEQGKPFKEALAEIQYGASFIEWFAEEAKRAYGRVIPSATSDKRILTIKQAVGVVAAITPWNFPNAMICRKIAPALAAGCTVLVKPSDETPLSALALAQLAHEAEIPNGVLNIITVKDPRKIGETFCADKRIRKLSFTGSTAVGKLLMKQAADNVKRISLELGGNAPFIVFNDADPKEAAKGAVQSKYRNAGQTCICSNRILVQKGIEEKFLTHYVEEVKALKTGNAFEDGVDIGPLINREAIDKVERLLEDAKSKGAQILCGGKAIGESLLFEPTVLSNANTSMDLHSTEIFGPVAPVFSFETEKEAIDLANDTNYGLAAYFYSRDIGRIWRVAEALEYGMVGINEGLISTAVAPFGGQKESGIGKEGAQEGLEEYLETKYLCLGGIQERN